MRVLVIPKNFEIGGSQINAVDLAEGVAQLGHDVVVGGPDGPLTEKVKGGGIEFFSFANRGTGRVRLVRDIHRAIEAVKPDIVHAYENTEVSLAFYVGAVALGLPVIGSFCGPRVPWYLPESLPVIVGTPQLERFTRRWRTARVGMVQSPVDTKKDSMDAHFAQYRAAPDEILAVCISRLVVPFKKEGLNDAIRGAFALAEQYPLRLHIVGDGPLRAVLAEIADKGNTRAGRPVVTFAGAVSDPRPYYGAADVVLGVGGAALRGMAFEKPTIILGRRGFAQTVSPDNVDEMTERGFFGVGDGAEDAGQLIESLGALASDPGLRRSVGEWSRKVVEERFGLRAASLQVLAEYEAARANPLSRSQTGWEGIRSIVRRGNYSLQRRRLRSRAIGLGMVGDEADNWTHGRLRELALPPARLGTGKNLKR